MMKIKGIKDFGIWLKKGEIVEVNNNLALTVIRDGYAQLIEFAESTDKRMINKEEMDRRMGLLKKYNLPLRQSYSLKFIIDFLSNL